MNSLYDIAIVGAGVSGLAAAREFTAQGKRVLILEKSRGLGGRLSTRRRGEESNPTLADLGAQFTYVRDEEWKKLLTSHSELTHPTQDSGAHFPRFIHPAGMSRLARVLLATGENAPKIELEKRVVRFEASKDTAGEWALFADDREGNTSTYRARKIVLAMPVPQTVELLESSNLTYESLATSMKALRELTYSRCLAVIATAPKGKNFAATGIREFKPSSEEKKLSGIFDQISKGLRSAASTLVLHASPEESLRIWDEDPSEITEKIWTAALPYVFGGDRDCVPFHPESLELHRWKYSRPTHFHPERFIILSLRAGNIGICGDAFQSGGIDGAFTSGTALARSGF